MCRRQVVRALLTVTPSNLTQLPMTASPRHLTDPLVDPEPATPSDDSIRVAQRLRETIRHKLLNRPEAPPDPYWTVGAD